MSEPHPSRERVHELLDRELDPRESADLRLHLRQCPGCAGRFGTLLEADRRLRGEAAPAAALWTLRRVAAALLLAIVAALPFLSGGPAGFPPESAARPPEAPPLSVGSLRLTEVQRSSGRVVRETWTLDDGGETIHRWEELASPGAGPMPTSWRETTTGAR